MTRWEPFTLIYFLARILTPILQNSLRSIGLVLPTALPGLLNEFEGTQVKLIERQVSIPVAPSHHSLISHIQKTVEVTLGDKVLPVRFVITGITETDYNCELGTLEGIKVERTF